MGKQIIKQPNGLFAIFSDNTDTIHMYDATPEEIMEYAERFALEAADLVRSRYRQKLLYVVEDKPELAYHQFVMTWQEALDDDKAHGGDVYAQQLKLI